MSVTSRYKRERWQVKRWGNEPQEKQTLWQTGICQHDNGETWIIYNCLVPLYIYVCMYSIHAVQRVHCNGGEIRSGLMVGQKGLFEEHLDVVCLLLQALANFPLDCRSCRSRLPTETISSCISLVENWHFRNGLKYTHSSKTFIYEKRRERFTKWFNAI